MQRETRWHDARMRDRPDLFDPALPTPGARARRDGTKAMRSDMFEVIIERPRVDLGRGRTKGRRREPRRLEEAPTWEPVSLGRGTKGLNENLAPLRRFLQSRVGRPWDAVRSEICQLITPRSAVQMHVLVHVKDMVEENTVLVDGRPHHPPGVGWRGGALIRGGRWGGFYVCPLTGALRAAGGRRFRRPRPEPDPDVKPLDELREARRIEGIWYLVTYSMQKVDGRWERCPSGKKQLSTREIRNLLR